MASKLTGRSQSVFAEPLPPATWAQIEASRLVTSDGQEIGAWFIRGRRPVTVLVLHANGGSRTACLPVMHHLADQGYSVMAISMRAHGDSSGTVNDLGMSARQDVVAAVQFIEKAAPGGRIVIVGQSLGAAAAIFAAGDCAGRVHGYLLEAPYLDLNTAVWNRCDNYLWPPFSYAAYLGLRLWAPIMLSDASQVRPIDHMGQIPQDVPVTILASADDQHARIHEARELYARIQSQAKLVVVNGGIHAGLFATHRQQYTEALAELLEAASAR